MIDSFTNIMFPFVEDHQRRLRDSARNARLQAIPREPVLRHRLGRLLIALGELVQGQRPSVDAEPADVRLATH